MQGGPAPGRMRLLPARYAPAPISASAMIPAVKMTFRSSFQLPPLFALSEVVFIGCLRLSEAACGSHTSAQSARLLASDKPGLCHLRAPPRLLGLITGKQHSAPPLLF
jgi:hypothetical protein